MAEDAWLSCLRMAAARDDDGRSDPASIAIAIRGECRTEFQQWQFATGLAGRRSRLRRFDPITAAIDDEKDERTQLELATSAILTARRSSP